MKHYQKLRTRNFIKLIIFPMIFIFSFFLVGCSNEKSGLDKDTEYEKTEEILGTVIIGKVYGEKVYCLLLLLHYCFCHTYNIIYYIPRC